MNNSKKFPSWILLAFASLQKSLQKELFLHREENLLDDRLFAIASSTNREEGFHLAENSHAIFCLVLLRRRLGSCKLD